MNTELLLGFVRGLAYNYSYEMLGTVTELLDVGSTVVVVVCD